MMYEAVKTADDSSVKTLQEIEDRLMEKFISSCFIFFIFNNGR